MAQVEDADLDVAVERVRHGVPEEHLLHPVARLRQRLEHAAGADVGDDVRLVAGLHPGERADEAGRDAEPARPGVELVADGRGRRRERGARVRRCRRRRRDRDGHVELRPDQQRARRVEAVHAREARETDPEVLRDPRERVAGLHDVEVPRRRGVPVGARATSDAQRLGAGDAVDRRGRRALERAHRALELRAEVAVERAV